MSVPADKVKGQEQPQSPGESTPAEPLREAFRRRLFAERKGEESASAEQPQSDDKESEGEVSEVPDEEYEASEEETTDLEESEDGGDVDSEEEPEGDGDEPTALTVDGRQYTAEDIKALESEREKREKEAKELDADYRRKTQVLARHRQEYEAMSQETEGVSSFMLNVAKSNLDALEKVDLSKLSPEETAEWKRQYDATKQGYSELQRYTEQVRSKIRENRDQMLNKQAEASSGVLSSIDPRWNDQSFYPKLRQFAIESGRYDAKEFNDVTDWRTLEGLIALMDKAEAEKTVQDKLDQQEPASRKRKNRRIKARRNKDSGRFESVEQAVFQSPNARGDGSLRNYFQERLARERTKR